MSQIERAFELLSAVRTHDAELAGDIGEWVDSYENDEDDWTAKNWGFCRHLFGEQTSCSMLKGLIPGEACSIHWHAKRFNKFVLVSAEIDVVLYEGSLLDGQHNVLGKTDQLVPLSNYEVVRYQLKPGASFDVPPNCVHSFEVVKTGDIVEIYWTENGEMPSQDDIHRIIAGRTI